jgi:hypothetical protein|tara:strand:+ start:2007 stop:2351 length:345 start_codon:yes stop_codon:yes gene_type:complete
MSSREISRAKYGESNEPVEFYGSRDPVVERVCDKFVSRSNFGFEKYGRTLNEERSGGHKDLSGYLNDVQEELMDAILYIQTARESIAADMGKMIRANCISPKETCDNCSCDEPK